MQRVELTEPFAQLLAPDWRATARGAQNTPDTPGRLPAPKTPNSTPPAPQDAPGQPSGDAYALTSAFSEIRSTNPDGDLVGAGSHKDGLVELCRRYSNHPDLLNPGLSPSDVGTLIESYQAGSTARLLAERYRVSTATVKRLLREHGVRKQRPRAVA